MPVFTETSSAWRDLRTLPSFAPPLPRLTPPAPKNVADKEEKYDVVVVGVSNAVKPNNMLKNYANSSTSQAGPAGLFLTTLLARYGLSDDSMICFDSKPGTLKAGQADGLQPRTLEVLQSLNLAHEILTESCHMREVAFWNPKRDQKLTTSSTNGLNGIAKTDSPNFGIERTSFVPDVAVPARFQHEITIHQGRIERILDEDLRRYSNRGIVRSTQFSEFEIDAASDQQYPLKITVSTGTGECSDRITKTVRAKYLVGADGAHSRVRHNMGLLLEGETTDHIWGVLDFVADTDFPDVRKRCAIHSDAGSIMIIPRERICTGEYLTRLYVQIMEEVPTDVNEQDTEVSETHKANSKQRRSAITQEAILAQAEKVMYPFKINVKSGTKPDWFAAYQIGQRMAPEFCLRDAEGIERIFIVGDGRLHLSPILIYPRLTGYKSLPHA
jgi:phenol 2-monooxygenase